MPFKANCMLANNCAIKYAMHVLLLNICIVLAVPDHASIYLCYLILIATVSTNHIIVKLLNDNKFKHLNWITHS